MSEPIDIAKGIKRAVDETGIKGKPISISFVGGERSEEAMQWLVENGIPAYGAPGVAINAMAALREYAIIKGIIQEAPDVCGREGREESVRIIHKARAEKRDVLTEIEAKQVFEAYGLPVARTLLAKTEEEAVKLAYEIGYPIVMKIVSPDILHKSDAGGVKVNLRDEKSVREAYRVILANAREYRRRSAAVMGLGLGGLPEEVSRHEMILPSRRHRLRRIRIASLNVTARP